MWPLLLLLTPSALFLVPVTFIGAPSESNSGSVVGDNEPDFDTNDDGFVCEGAGAGEDEDEDDGG